MSSSHLLGVKLDLMLAGFAPDDRRTWVVAAASKVWVGRDMVSRWIGSVWPNANYSPYPPIQVLGQIVGRCPNQGVKVPDIELELVVFFSPARWNNCKPEPQCETCFKIDVVPLTGVVSHDEARAPNLGIISSVIPPT